MRTAKVMDDSSREKLFDHHEAAQRYSYKRQLMALVVKHSRVQKRQYRTNCCQILFPLLLVALLFIMQMIVDSIVNNMNIDVSGIVFPTITSPFFLMPWSPTANRECPNSTTYVLDSERGFFHIFPNGVDFGEVGGDGILGNLTSTDHIFVYSGLLYHNVEKFFEQGGRPPEICRLEADLFTNFSFISHTTLADYDSYIFDSWHTQSVPAGYIVNEYLPATKQFDIGISYNKTLTEGYDLKRAINFFTNAIFQSILPHFVPGESEMFLSGYKFMPQLPSNPFSFDLISIIGPFLYIYIFTLMFPVMMSSVVAEKEAKLREIMKMMGLKTHIYWIVTYLFNYMMYLVAVFFVIILAHLLGFRYYTENDFWTYFILLFIWGHTMLAMAFFFSVFFEKSSTATVVGYLFVFGSAILAVELVSSFFENPETPAGAVFALQLFPPFALFRGLQELSYGVMFGSPGHRSDVIFSWHKGVHLGEVFVFLILEWLVFLVLSIYLEMVWPSSVGTHRHPCFCFKNPKNIPQEVDEDDIKSAALLDDLEQHKVLARTDKTAAIAISSLRKVFRIPGISDKIAVRDLSLAIYDKQCFGVLGPNGSGKTTTINMLCGYLAPTSGDAFIFGNSVYDNMDDINLMMGVCPQENVLWGDLTGSEHLEFYGRLKGLTGPELELQIATQLSNVRLSNVKDKLSKEYSGGMKRRLCVAISMIGNPSILLMDEPTTGLDPASRNELWNVILEVKKKACVLLTTHSMEEAETLCDTLAIMDRGVLRCVGTSAELKHRFEKGYRLHLNCNVDREKEVHDLLMQIAPKATLLNSLAGTRTYMIPTENTKLSHIFRQLDEKAAIGLNDWGISNTSLEEVFLEITRESFEQVQRQESILFHQKHASDSKASNSD